MRSRIRINATHAAHSMPPTSKVPTQTFHDKFKLYFTLRALRSISVLLKQLPVIPIPLPAPKFCTANDVYIGAFLHGADIQVQVQHNICRAPLYATSSSAIHVTDKHDQKVHSRAVL